MKISIVTVAFNAEATIADTLRSVSCQTYGNVEHILIDGASTDGTMDVVRQNGAHLARCISEPDRGIYDAMNKGIALATGDVIGFLNADDVYAGPYVLELVAGGFSSADVDACYGDLCYVRQNHIDSIVRYWRSSDFEPGRFSQGWNPPHPTFFARRDVFAKHGSFDLSYRIAADIELMMRFLEVGRISTLHLPHMMVRMRLGGTTNKSIKNIIKQNGEIMRALNESGLKWSPVSFICNKLLSRGRQFVTRPGL
ncbi:MULTISPECIES: glycosyltransferase family 2 protein [Rhizobium]|jgi:glycosyltransferase involved in cell wall biosynthesis|uniref:glycosyltransferase family 2 protein n=1 Tax=Rhizobium TaxID=379 RepID=UPI000522F242|nr:MULTISPECIES: glycosyltransferase family 2 protein [Rhizobium]KPN26518.1 family 2 glycosyl transferase [Rhizobium brockwellii]MDV4153144.1 glycosyltransferase family 2 protein [Rhizobium brockwellii]QJX03825.1 glycosyltransferase [Rhizobium brockwellii]TAV72397.1 glycosyltransferase [Rhizobium leguminosarum]TAV76998.1 glycosyltransferase [Rhizobium leguminosarum]